jgi:hypothetical protein
MDDGYDMLRKALDEAHAAGARVRVTLLGESGGSWDFTPGDHVERDGSVHFGGSPRRVRAVMPDSTIVGTYGGRLVWCGGHSMADDRHTRRFNHDGAAMTLEWTA